jgi:hypothetical protein
VADTPQYERGAGDAATGTPMPQGEAQSLNDSVSAMPAPEAGASAPQAEAAPAPEVQPAQPGANIPAYQPDNEDDQFITGPTLRPDEPQTAGIPTGAGGVPPDVVRGLPLLQRAAQEPGADPKLQTLVNLVLHELGRG